MSAEPLFEEEESLFDVDEEEPSREPLNFYQDETESTLNEEEVDFDPEDEAVSLFLSNINLDTNPIEPTSFDSIDPFKPKKPKSGIIYQNKERKINNTLVLRNKVKLTPSVCDIPSCLYDAAKTSGYGEWKRVPANRRRLVQHILEKHKEKNHTFIEAGLCDEVDLPSSWLGPIDSM